ncbi:hypothetical protein BUALT_Bualt01G0210300 [Buddleja alternifolia]|uniref:Uncharacterized protein n=1 Tax=Buddleja alternifolia TaxID=168488 RepID=A0AAV6Y9U6_9LAMI|nr:hypothetical protein BUALT_Bualt01G0210300 [Buddleja alternifolia]
MVDDDKKKGRLCATGGTGAEGGCWMRCAESPMAKVKNWADHAGPNTRMEDARPLDTHKWAAGHVADVGPDFAEWAAEWND